MDNNETPDAIVKEIRSLVQEAREYPRDVEITTADAEDWADRLEAALKRRQIGLDTLSDGRSATVAVAEQRNHLARLDVEYAGLLNMVAARKALKEIHAWCHNQDNPDCLVRENCEYLAVAALSAPARNCDVGTAEEQAARLRQYCLDKDSLDCRHYCMQSPKAFDCSMEWAQMPYEAEGGAE